MINPFNCQNCRFNDVQLDLWSPQFFRRDATKHQTLKGNPVGFSGGGFKRGEFHPSYLLIRPFIGVTTPSISNTGHNFQVVVSNMSLFLPPTSGDDPLWGTYVSNRLVQPPTSFCMVSLMVSWTYNVGKTSWTTYSQRNTKNTSEGGFFFRIFAPGWDLGVFFFFSGGILGRE